MTLGVTPGPTTTEWILARAYAGAALGAYLAGAFAASFDWPGKQAGLLTMVLSAALAAWAFAWYVAGRSRVKAHVGVERVRKARIGM